VLAVARGIVDHLQEQFFSPDAVAVVVEEAGQPFVAVG
jgi:hypothetical protein